MKTNKRSPKRSPKKSSPKRYSPKRYSPKNSLLKKLQKSKKNNHRPEIIHAYLDGIDVNDYWEFGNIIVFSQNDQLGKDPVYIIGAGGKLIKSGASEIFFEDRYIPGNLIYKKPMRREYNNIHIPSSIVIPFEITMFMNNAVDFYQNIINRGEKITLVLPSDDQFIIDELGDIPPEDWIFIITFEKGNIIQVILLYSVIIMDKYEGWTTTVLRNDLKKESIEKIEEWIHYHVLEE